MQKASKSGPDLADVTAGMGTGLINLTLRIGAWGKHGARPGQPLSDAERDVLAAEYRRRMLIEAGGWLAKAKAADDTEWIAAVERTLDSLRR